MTKSNTISNAQTVRTPIVNFLFKRALGNCLLLLASHTICAQGNTSYKLNSAPVTGTFNVGVGEEVLGNATGAANSAVGYRALYLNTTGNNNIAIGYGTMRNSLSGNWNVASGTQALYSNATGNSNVANGYKAIF